MKNDKLVKFIKTTIEESYHNEYKFFVHTYDDFIFVDSQEALIEFHFYLDEGSVSIDAGELTISNLEATHKICVAIKNGIFK